MLRLDRLLVDRPCVAKKASAKTEAQAIDQIKRLLSTQPSLEARIDFAVIREDLDALEEVIFEMAFDLLEQHDDDVERTVQEVADRLYFRLGQDELDQMGFTGEILCDLVAAAYEAAMEIDAQAAAKQTE